MRVNLLLLFFFMSHVALAQGYSLDTTFIINTQTINISTKDIDSNTLILTSTINSENTLVDSIDSWGAANISLPDFDHDGYSDILLEYFGNNPTYYLYLFDSSEFKFKEVKNYMNFPGAIQLDSNKKYYYSYHRAGCADANWVSDLFKIENFNITHLAHIYGQGCEADEQQVIDIYKVISGDDKKMKKINTLPYSQHIKFGDKWDFIEQYWNNNFHTFEG